MVRGLWVLLRVAKMMDIGITSVLYRLFEGGELKAGELIQDLTVVKISKTLRYAGTFPGQDRRFAGKKAFDALLSPGDTCQKRGRFAGGWFFSKAGGHTLKKMPERPVLAVENVSLANDIAIQQSGDGPGDVFYVDKSIDPFRIPGKFAPGAPE